MDRLPINRDRETHLGGCSAPYTKPHLVGTISTRSTGPTIRYELNDVCFHALYHAIAI